MVFEPPAREPGLHPVHRPRAGHAQHWLLVFPFNSDICVRIFEPLAGEPGLHTPHRSRAGHAQRVNTGCLYSKL